MSTEHKSGHFLTQASFPKRGKTRKGATSFLDYPTVFPECTGTNVNQMRNVQEAGLTDLENQTEQAEFASRHLVDMKVAIDSLLLKKTARRRRERICNRIKSGDCIIPVSCCRQSFYQSPSGKPQKEATLPRCCWRPQPETELTTLLWWWHEEDWNVTSSCRDALPPSNAWQ